MGAKGSIIIFHRLERARKTERREVVGGGGGRGREGEGWKERGEEEIT